MIRPMVVLLPHRLAGFLWGWSSPESHWMFEYPWYWAEEVGPGIVTRWRTFLRGIRSCFSIPVIINSGESEQCRNMLQVWQSTSVLLSLL